MAESKLSDVLNPRNALPEKFKFGKKTLWEKFQGAFWLSFGAIGSFNGKESKKKDDEGFTLGIAGWILLLPLTPFLLVSPLLLPLAPLATILSPILAVILWVLVAVYCILNAIITAALMIAASPFIVVVHAIWGPPDPNGTTSIRRSFWLNPMTYVMAALLAVGISLLIQGVNPSVFFDAAAPLMITQTVLMSLAALALVAGLLYVMYRAGLAIVSSINDKKFQHVDIETTKEAQANYITKYLGEHGAWIKKNWGKATFFYGLIFAGVGTVTLLVANHLTAGLLFGAGTENIMKVLFDFMGAGFASGLQSMAGLPGLEFLAASDATLAIIGQVLTVFTLLAAAIVVPYTGARLCQTAQEEFSSSPDGQKGMKGRDRKAGESSFEHSDVFKKEKEEPKPAPILAGLYQVKAKHEFEAMEAGDLSIKMNEILTVIKDQEDPNWWTVRNAAGKEGTIPSNYVEVIDRPNVKPN